jgi:putative ABC transport system permease protein
VGIKNVMLFSVTERRPEIGLLKAMGATGIQILSVFLAEALLLSCAGGAAGLATGWAAVHLLTRIYPEFPASPPAWAVISALALSVAVGMAFGLWPAYRASRLDPVLSLQKR